MELEQAPSMIQKSRATAILDTVITNLIINNTIELLSIGQVLCQKVGFYKFRFLINVNAMKTLVKGNDEISGHFYFLQKKLVQYLFFNNKYRTSLIVLNSVKFLTIHICNSNYSSETARNNSLMPTFASVFASTFFTIIAAYKLYVPQAEGKLPGTTTEPAGTRP